MPELSRKAPHTVHESAFCDIDETRPCNILKASMGDTGPEHPPLTPSKTPIPASSGAKSDAPDAPKPPQDPDLAALVKAWPALPGHIKAAIKALIQTH